MANSYIVDLLRWSFDDDKYHKTDDAILKLYDNGRMTLEINDIYYLDVNIIDQNIYIISRHKHHMAYMSDNLLSIDCEIYYNGSNDEQKFALRFDSASSSSEQHFYDQFTKLKNKTQFVEYYQSGNKRIEGTKIDKGYCGLCIEYYDNSDSSIKYIGEFENNLYDGGGDFFSEDGIIRLTCNNICNNVPNGTGMLIIGHNKIHKIINMNNFDMLDPKDDDYINNICRSALASSVDVPNYDIFMETIRFECMDTNNKMLYLFYECQNINNEHINAHKKLDYLLDEFQTIKNKHINTNINNEISTNTNIYSYLFWLLISFIIYHFIFINL